MNTLLSAVNGYAARARVHIDNKIVYVLVYVGGNSCINVEMLKNHEKISYTGILFP